MGIQLIAMVVLAAFYGCHVVRMICQEKEEIQTDQIEKGKAGFIKLIRVTMKTSAFPILGVGTISIAFDASNGPISIRTIDATVSAVGTAVFIIAVLIMCDSWWAGVPPTDKTEPVTNGIYQLSRSPAFLGSDLLYIDILLMFFSWGLCVAFIFTILMYHLQIVCVEEMFLLATFRDEYLQYKRRVYRYIGIGNGYRL